MLKIISCKNESQIYSFVRKEPFFVKTANDEERKKFFLIDINIDEAVASSENISIFGDTNAFMIKITREDELEKINLNLLKSLGNSEHLFVIVGNGVEFEKKVTEEGGKFLKLEEIRKNDFPAELVAALQKNDKKNSWNLLLKELNKNEAEPIHGSCIFAYKSLLVYLNDTKKNSLESGVKDFSWRQAGLNARAGKREKDEVINKYFNLIVNYHLARMGKGDLAKQLESWVLEN